MNSIIGTPFLSQELIAISFLSGKLSFKLFRHIWWLYVHPLLWLFFDINSHKGKLGFIAFYPYDVIEIFIAIFIASF
jgi:hypothetical protein